MAIQYRKIYTPDSGNGLATTRYTAHDPDARGVWGSQGKDLAIVEVEHHPQTPFTHRGGIAGPNTVPGVRTYSDAYPPTSRHTVRGQKDKWGNPVKESVPMLFSDSESRPHHKLSLMSSALDHGRTAMSLMALAHQDVSNTGIPLVPDSYLTKDSLRIVRHLSSLGMVSKADVPKRASVPSHQVMPLTGSSFGYFEKTGQFDGVTVEDIPHARIREARNNLAQTMRSARQQKQSRKKQSMEGQPTIFDQ